MGKKKEHLMTRSDYVKDWKKRHNTEQKEKFAYVQLKEMKQD